MKRLILAAIAFLATGLYGQVPLAITNISPSSTIAGSPTFTLTVTGTGFERAPLSSGYYSTSIVRWDGVALDTGYLNLTQRLVTVSASLVANAGTVTVDVVNLIDQQVSNPVVFTILAPLVITTPSPLPPATFGSFYSRTLAASGGTPPYGNWRVVEGALPSGLTLSASGVLSGTPTSAGTTTVQINVDDSANRSATGLFSLTVNVPPLSITTTSLPSGTVGGSYSQLLAATGGIPPYSWSVPIGALPPGLTLSTAGLLSGTPTQTGPNTFTIAVSAGNATASQQFALTVNPPALSITTTSLANGTVGVAYSQTLAATGGTGSYTWSVTVGQPPPGLALSPAGLLSGTPTQTGSFPFTIAVNGAASRQFTLTVNQSTLSITTTSLPNGMVGATYLQALLATGGIQPRRWTLVQGPLPDGLTLNPDTGFINGAPTTAGSYTFTVGVTDSLQTTVTRVLTMTVTPATLEITTPSPLSNGTVGVPYSRQLAATGGSGALTWSASGLPAGLTLSQAGLLSGTPATAGTFTFTVTVNGIASKQFTLIVTVPAAPVLSITDVPATPGQQPSFNVQLSSAYTLGINGTVALTFTPDSGLPDDPNILFQNGTRTLDFTIAAGSTVSPAALQTGTVAGRIDLTTTRLLAAGQSILPSPAPVRSIQIPRSAPSISSVQVVRTSGGFDVQVRGFSTPRQVTQALFVFTAAAGKNLQTSQVTLPVDSAFTTWYNSTTSGQFGSTFLYTQPFTIQGDASSIASISVTLTNAVGNSQAVSATF